AAPARSFASRVSTLPRIPGTSRSARIARSCARRRRLPVATRAFAGSARRTARPPAAASPPASGARATITSRTSARSGTAAIAKPRARSAGTSFSECTATSMAPAASASSISFRNKPLPPTFASDTFASLSPVVRMTTSSTAWPSASSRRAIWPLCASASALPRVPSRSGCAPASAFAIVAGFSARSGRGRRRFVGDVRRRRGIEGEQPVDDARDLGGRLAVLALRDLLQDRERNVQDLVHDRARHRLERASLVGLEPAQGGERTLELDPPDAVELAAERDDRGRQVLARHRAPEALRLLVDDLLRAHGLSPPLRPVLVGDARQVVDVVEVDVLDVVDAGVEVARHPEVDEEHRAAPPRAQHVVQLRRPEDVTGRGDGAEDDVGEVEVLREALERDRRAAERARQLDGAIERTVRHDDARDAVALQVAGRELAHLAGADHHRGLVAEVVEDALREVDRRGADGHGLAGDAGLRADPLRDAERALQAAAEEPAGGPRLGRDPVLLLQLPEDLRLADHHRVEARRDPEEVVQRVLPAALVAVDRERRRRHRALPREEADDRVARVAAAARDRQDLDPVARRQDQRLDDARRVREQAARGAREVLLGNREALPDLDRRRVMAHAD